MQVRLPARTTDNRINTPDQTSTRTSAASESDSAEGATKPE